MPDVPNKLPVLSPPESFPIIRESHAFTSRSFNKINLLGGPFNVKLYRNVNGPNNYASVDVEAEQSFHKLISMEVDQSSTLSIRMTDSLSLNNKTNITILIVYQELTELNIDGIINVQCINRIQTNVLRVFVRGTGSVKLKLHVNVLDAYFHSIGRVKLCGQVNDDAVLKSLGVGDVQCQHLLTKKINVISSGIGNIYVTATDEINVTLSGIGIVYYSGPLKQHITTGLGSIIERPNVSSSYDQQLSNETPVIE